MENNNHWNSLSKALLGKSKDEYESVRESIINEKGYDYFRKLQNDIFWDIADREGGAKKK